MAPVTRSQKKKEEEQSLATQSKSSSSIRGVKRSAEKEGNDKSKKTVPEKRGRRRKEPEIRLEKAEEEISEEKRELKKELIESQVESSDSYHSKTSFMDLPDDVHINISAFIDFPTRLQLRVNRRLDRLHFSTKNTLKRIGYRIGISHAQLTIGNRNPDRLSIDYLTQWEDGLRRFATNTFVDEISISVDTVPNDQQCRVLDALFQFKASRISIYGRQVTPIHLSSLNLPSFLTMVQNIREIFIETDCLSLTAQDLCIIRKNILEGCCAKTVNILLDSGMIAEFMKDCFGLKSEEVSEPVHGIIYRSMDASLEMYRVRRLFEGWFLLHFESDLQTYVKDNCISFKKLEVVQKPPDRFKLRLNHIYEDY